MIRRPPRSTHTVTLCPTTTLVRSTARRVRVRHPVLPQRALAGAAVLLHVPAALRDHARRIHHPLSRLDEGNPRPFAAGHGERLGGREIGRASCRERVCQYV